jgi:alpha-L-arabinofuranosidase
MMRRPFGSWVLIVGTLVAAAMLPRAHAEELRVQVEVCPDDVRGPISPYVFGAGIDPKTNPLRFPRYPDKVLQDIADSGLRIARFPGGFVFNRNAPRESWANFYWQDHIGKNPDRRPTEVYDLDTFLQLCERFDIEPLMQINFVGEPEDSVRGYIEYLVGTGDTDGDGINWAARRAANGRVKPYRIRYWELGNELHSYEQGFHETAAGAQEYARALDRLVPMVRKLAPGAKIVVPFINIQRPRSEMKLPASLADINVATSSEFALSFLRSLHVRVDYFDWHFYAANGWGGNWPYLGTDDEWKHYYCWGTKFRECHQAIAKLIADECRQVPPPKIIVGEWAGDWTAAIFREYEGGFRGSMMRTMASGVFMGDILMYMMAESVPVESIHAAFWHTFSNDAQALFSVQTTREQGISYKGKSTDAGYGYRMPIYWVFKLLSEQRGESLVSSRVQGDGMIAAPRDGLYTDPAYQFPRVTEVASRSGDTLYLALLNRDAHQQVAVEIGVQGWKLRPTMQVSEVGASSYLAENTIAQPNRVTLSGPHQRQLRDPREIEYLLRPTTLAVLQFQQAR